jgi:hypothetical protein
MGKEGSLHLIGQTAMKKSTTLTGGAMAEKEGFVCIFANAKIKERLHQAVAGNCPPDSCIEKFKSQL